MAYEDRYLEYLNSVPKSIELCQSMDQRTVLAYTSNLDAIVKWNVEGFNRLLSDYLKDEPSFTEEEAVHSMEDFARIVSYFAIHGHGGEVDLCSQEVVDRLGDYFEIGYGLGGTCAQGAAALGTLGFPALIHITDLSPEVLAWMNYPRLEIVEGNKRVLLKELKSNGKTPLIHVIMQYTKGDILKIHGREYEVKLSNRLIMGFDQVHKVMPVDSEFLRYCEEHANNICSYDISGFNAILNEDILKQRLDELTAHYQIVKSRNPDCVIYLESAHFLSSKIREYTYSRLSEYIDIMGMNEEELVDLTSKMHRSIDKDDIHSVIQGLTYLLEVYPVKGIVMHSKDYALYFGSSLGNADIEKGLTLGNLMSGTRARIGRYGSMEDCLETLSLPLSETGCQFADEVAHMNLKQEAILVPSRYMERPAFTIGLGDTFVAGVQVCFLKGILYPDMK